MTPPPPASWRYRLFLFLYGAVLALGEPLVWRYFRKRAQKDPAYGAFAGERRGEGAAFAADVWVHAVSLGEMRSAVPLVRDLLGRGLRVVTTHMTPAGRRAASEAFATDIEAGRLAVRWAPIDRQGYWARFFDATGPRVGLVMEMEFWPGMFEAAARDGVALYPANSQVPSKSLPGARRMARLVGHPVARAAGVLAKSARMAERFRDLGARNVAVMGETRFDIAPPEAHLAAGAALGEGRPVVTFASVVAGEEETCLAAARHLLALSPRPRIIWVPRAPELFASTSEMLRDAGLDVARRSEAFDSDLAPMAPLDADVLVGDSMGEMFFYLSPADVVVVGGGFVEKGAHNIIEPLALGKPVITGPHVWTIEYPGVEAEAAGVLTITDGAELGPAIAARLGAGDEQAAAFHGANVGASARIAARVAAILEDME